MSEPKEVESASVEQCERCGCDYGVHLVTCPNFRCNMCGHAGPSEGHYGGCPFREPKEVESGGLPPLDVTEAESLKASSCSLLNEGEKSLFAKLICRERQLKASLLREKELPEAVNWLMGCAESDFIKPEGAPTYWWRSEFAKRAGIEYDGKKYVLKAAVTGE